MISPECARRTPHSKRDKTRCETPKIRPTQKPTRRARRRCSKSAPIRTRSIWRKPFAMLARRTPRDARSIPHSSGIGRSSSRSSPRPHQSHRSQDHPARPHRSSADSARRSGFIATANRHGAALLRRPAWLDRWLAPWHADCASPRNRPRAGRKGGKTWIVVRRYVPFSRRLRRAQDPARRVAAVVVAPAGGSRIGSVRDGKMVHPGLGSEWTRSSQELDTHCL